MTKIWTQKVPPTMVVSILQFREGPARYKHFKFNILPGLGIHYPPQSWLYFAWGELLSQSRWRAWTMVRMPLTHTPGALVLAFHFRCYTTDSNKRWEFCDAPICAATTTTTTAKGKFSYTYLHRKVFYITYPARFTIPSNPMWFYGFIFFCVDKFCIIILFIWWDITASCF